MKNLRPSIGFEDANEINTIELNNKKEQSFGLTGNLYFAKVILERNIFVKIKVYLIQPKGISKTELKFIGKIAGIKKVSINYAQKASSKELEKIPFAVAILGILGIIMIFTSRALSRRQFLVEFEEIRTMEMLRLERQMLLKAEKKFRKNE